MIWFYLFLHHSTNKSENQQINFIVLKKSLSNIKINARFKKRNMKYLEAIRRQTAINLMAGNPGSEYLYKFIDLLTLQTDQLGKT